MDMDVFKRIMCLVGVAFTVLTMGESQYAIRPTNSVTDIRTSTIINCSAEDINENIIWYEYVTHPDGIQISFNEDLRHPNEGKYDILGKYDLLINDTQGSDAGTYSCHLPDRGTYSYMELFVIRTSYSTCREDFIEFQNSELCRVDVNFYGRWKGDGQVTGLADDSKLTLNVYNYEHSYKDLDVRAELNARMINDKIKYTCAAIISAPQSSDLPLDRTFHHYDRSSLGQVHRCTGIISMQYLVRDMCIKPNLAENMEVAVGDEITCNTTGNPTPNVRWYNVIGPETTDNGFLLITPDMLGLNTYECVAHNSINEEHRTIKQEVQFMAVNGSVGGSIPRDSCTPTEPGATTQSNATQEDSTTTESGESGESGRNTPNTGMIIGIVCGVAFVIVVAIISAVLFIRNRADSKKFQESQMCTSSDPRDFGHTNNVEQTHETDTISSSQKSEIDIGAENSHI